MKPICAGALLLMACVATSSPVFALEFGSAAHASILYAAPASTAAKIAVVNAGYPLEKVIVNNSWVKVRDDTGALGWIEASAFSAKRTVLVNAPFAQISEKPLDSAPVRFRAQRGVMLDMLAPAEGGWLKVRHASGQEGYARMRDVWGL